MEKISVVVTVYNIETYIEMCLQSILQQKYRNIELVIVDDGSTDSSGRLCDEIAEKDNRVTVIHQKNQGPVLARLHGVEAVQGDYITFVDGDDWVDENLYQDIVDSGFLGKADLISFGIYRYRGKEDIFAEPYMFEEGIYLKDQIAVRLIPKMFWNIDRMSYGLDPSLWSKIFLKELLLKHLRNSRNLNIHYGEDIAVLYPLILDTTSIGIINKRYYYHRIRRNDSIPTYISDKEFFSKLFRLYQYLQGYFERAGSPQLLKQLDYFYMYSTELKKICYHDLAFENQYMFPFHKVPKDCRLVIYGAGHVGQTFLKQLGRVDYCKIAGWVDRDYEIYHERNVKPIEKLSELEFDYILIAISGKETADKITKNLLRMGIGKEKIICL